MGLLGLGSDRRQVRSSLRPLLRRPIRRTDATVFRGGVILIGLVFLGLTGGVALVVAEEDTQPPREIDAHEVEEFILITVNEIREQHGLEPLEKHKGLEMAAYGHSESMLTERYYDHVTPDGITHQDRVSSVGLECRASENIANAYHHRLMYFEDTLYYLRSEELIANWLVDAWMHSPPHRANILSPDFSYHGAGVVSDERGKLYATHKFCGQMTVA